MKIIVKTLRNAKHELELSGEDTVADLKVKIAGMNLADVDAQKLLHKGRVLRDSQLASETFVENDTVILMKSRKKKKPSDKKKVTTEPEPELTDENSPRGNVQMANTLARPGQPSVQQLDADGVYKQIRAMQEAKLEAEAEAKINQLATRTGSDKASAAQALALAKGDAELAYSYLTQGVPPEVALNAPGLILSEEQKQQVRRVVEAKARAQAARQAQAEANAAEAEAGPAPAKRPTPEQQVSMIQGQRIAAQQAAEAQLAADPSVDLQGMPPRLAMLMSNPQMLQQVMSNPMVQQQIQGIMARDMPQLFARFQEDPDAVGETEEFQRVVFQILGTVMGRQQKRAKPNIVRLSKEQSDGITAMEQEFEGRFSRQALLQSYMACGQDFDQLREFLRQQARRPSIGADGTQQTSLDRNPADDCDPE